MWFDKIFNEMVNITELYNENIENYSLAAIFEKSTPSKIQKYFREYLNLSPNSKYFNAGVLLIDLKKWIANNTTEKLFEYEKSYRNVIKLADQDILNKYFDNNYQVLPEKYNYMNETSWKNLNIDKPIIRHFNGEIKPWQILPEYNTKLLNDIDIFWYYAQKTPFYEKLYNETKNLNHQRQIIRQLQVAKLRLDAIRKQEEKIPIFLASDNNYAPLISTTIASICDNTKSQVNFYILDGGISQENKFKINGLKNKFNNFTIEFINIDTKKYFEDFITTGTLNVSTYYRFLLADLKPNLNKVIYLDVDLIITGDIVKLYNENMDGFSLAACSDSSCEGNLQLCKKNLEMDKDSKYFNAGVLLINLKEWREKNICKKLFDTEKQYRGRLENNDQDVLNKCFEKNYKELDRKYNVVFENKEIFIKHFAGKIKPWQADFYLDKDMKPQKITDNHLFWKYAVMTPFYKDFQKEYSDFINSNILYKRFNKMVGNL